MERACVLGFRGLAIGVSVAGRDGAAIEAWLAAFFGPSFSRVERVPDVDVTLTIDAALAATVVRDAVATGREIDWMTRDQGQVLLPVWRAAHGRELVREGEVVIVPRLRGGVGGMGGADLFAADDGRKTRMTLMRVVRELASGAARVHGDVPLHASAVVAGGGATVFVGPKMAGKTTLLCHSLGHAGAQYLANDRVFVDPVSGVARGMPTIVKLRAGTLPIGEARFDPPELCAHLGVEAVGSAVVKRLVFVDPVRIAADLELTEIDVEVAATLLAEHGLVAGGAQAAMFAREVPPLDLDGLVRAVPCFHLALGPNVYAPANSASTRSLIGL